MGVRVSRLLLPVVAAGIVGMFLFGGCQTTPTASPLESYFSDVRSRATVYVEPSSTKTRKIAILPFKAPTELIGSSVSELFITEMLKCRRFTLVERSQIAKVLGESELSLSGITAAKAVELGTMVGADGVIVGTVDQYETQAVKGKTFPVVGITIRLIDCKTGRVGWSADLAAKASSGDEALSTHARKIVHEIAAGLFWEWRKYEPPPEPVNVAVSDMGLREATLSWKKPTVSGVKYTIERAPSPDGPFRAIAGVSASSGSFKDTDLADASTYYYRITAVAGNGLKIDPTRAVETFTAPPPQAIAGVRCSQDLVGSILVEWNAAPEVSVIAYEIEHSRDGATWSTTGRVSGRTRTQFLDGGREPGDLGDLLVRAYRVRAVNKVGAKGAFSESATGQTRAVPPPVQGLSVESDLARKVVLHWVASEDEKVKGYEVRRATPGIGIFETIKKINGRDATEFLDTGRKGSFFGGMFSSDDGLGELADDSEYEYRVIAVNIGGRLSGPSETITARTKKPPSAPESIEASSGHIAKVILEWSSSPEADIDFYLLERAEEKKGKYKRVASVPHVPGGTVLHEDLKAPNDTRLLYRVSAMDKSGLQSEWSDVASGDCKPVPKTK